MGRKNIPKKEDKGPGVPAYIVTFSDMVTLLLTFFVLLLSMASSQEEELFKVGQESFKRAVASFGLEGFLVSKRSVSQFEHDKPKYYVDKDEENTEDQSVDLRQDTLQKVVYKLEKLMEVSPSTITGANPEYSPLKINFSYRSSKVPFDARQKVIEQITQLRAARESDMLTIYVVGIANQESSEDRNLLLSAKRAAAIAALVRENSPENWQIYSWGAGSGGDWTSAGGVASEKCDILLGLLIK